MELVYLGMKHSSQDFSIFVATKTSIMALVHEMENSGNWLFKRRSWLPLILVFSGLIIMYLGNKQAIIFNLRDEMIFLGISIFGELIRVFTVGFAPRNTSGEIPLPGRLQMNLTLPVFIQLSGIPSISEISSCGLDLLCSSDRHGLQLYFYLFTGFTMKG